jgi:hypothetical protein
MERKTTTREKKMPGGIALKPSLWRRIEQIAEADGKSKNEVMEEVLSAHVPHNQVADIELKDIGDDD